MMRPQDAVFPLGRIGARYDRSFKLEGYVGGRSPCLPIRRAATGGRPYTAEGQLRAIPHYSSILSFHHPAPNKPNFGPGGRKDKCRVDKEL